MNNNDPNQLDLFKEEPSNFTIRIPVHIVLGLLYAGLIWGLYTFRP